MAELSGLNRVRHRKLTITKQGTNRVGQIRGGILEGEDNNIR